MVRTIDQVVVGLEVEVEDSSAIVRGTVTHVETDRASGKVTRFVVAGTHGSVSVFVDTGTGRAKQTKRPKRPPEKGKHDDRACTVREQRSGQEIS